MVKAAVCREHGAPFTIEEVTLASPGPGEIRVEVAACGVCHSDLHYAAGDFGGPLPAVYGHEAAGVVAEVGDGVDDLAVGDHVVVTLIRPCGSCRACERGLEVECSRRWPLDEQSPIRAADGEPIWNAMRCGAFAEEIVVGETQAVKIPDSVPWDAAALLACGVITGVGAVRSTAGVAPGDSVVVVGAGGVGLNAIQGARLAGADPIIAVDLSAEQLASARDFGATDTIDGSRDDVRARVRDLTDGRMADHVLVTVGAPAPYQDAPRLLALAGAMVMVGLPANDVRIEIAPTIMASQSQRILGSHMGGSVIRVDIPELVGRYEAGELQLDELVTHRYPLERINEAVAETAAGGVRRNVIVFERS